MKQTFDPPPLDVFLHHAVELLRVKGYEVTLCRITLQRTGARVQFKLNPPPPGRGAYDWRVPFHQRKGGFYQTRYQNTTINTTPAKLLEYINELPWVTENQE